MAGEDKAGWSSVVNKFLEWLKTVAPIAVFSAIVRWYKRKAWFAERKIEQKELEINEHENKETVEKKYADIDDVDIVADAIREGRGDDSSS